MKGASHVSKLSPAGILLRHRPGGAGTLALMEEVDLLRGQDGLGAANGEFDDAALYMARDLVLLQDGLSGLEYRALFVLTLATLIGHRQGSTRIPLDFSPGGSLDALFEMLLPRAVDEAPGWARGDLMASIKAVIDAGGAPYLFGAPGDYRPLIVADGQLYHQRMLFYEDRLVEGLARRHGGASTALAALAEPRQKGLAKELSRGKSAMSLNAEQLQAVQKALTSRLTIVTGGPGTGKTSVVVSILKALVTLGLGLDAIALAAPTGKAAHRMAESIEGQLSNSPGGDEAAKLLMKGHYEAKTLHRLLGYSPRGRGFRFHQDNPLPHRVVIVDEASMIDLFLMEQLLGALGEETHLVLLGDADQLPSVDTGAVLRDLVEDPLVPTRQHALRLVQSYRMDPSRVSGRKILQVARHVGNAARAVPLIDVRDDVDGELLIQRRQRVRELVHGGVELLEGGDVLSAFVDHWFTERIAATQGFSDLVDGTYHHGEGGFEEKSTARLDRLFAHYGSFRVLTLTRVQGTGSEKLDAAFHRRFVGRKKDDDGWDFVAGEPVMMLRNDYERGLFNGDQGVVAWVRRAGQPRAELMVVFPGKDGYRPFFLGALRNHLEHAFSMTVHKSQGSEFKDVALVLPLEDMALLTREVLYTGLTRASESVVIVGAMELLEKGARRGLRRFSGISEKLVAKLGPAAPAIVSAADAPVPVQGELF